MASSSRARSSRGRQRIEIRRRENVDERRVAFTKRRMGLFEKAAELCVLCGAKIAILTFSEGRKAFCFGNPELDTVLEGYLSQRCSSEIEPSGPYLQAVNESRQLYLEALAGLESEKAGQKSTVCPWAGPGRFWWDAPVEDLRQDELKFYRDALEKMKKNVESKIEEYELNDIVNQENPVVNGNFAGQL